MEMFPDSLCTGLGIGSEGAGILVAFPAAGTAMQLILLRHALLLAVSFPSIIWAVEMESGARSLRGVFLGQRISS
jgi:hypothetical protein